MKNQGNMTPQKDPNNFPVTNPKDMSICNLSDKKIKIAGLRKLREPQKNPETQNTERQFDKIRKTIEEQNEKFNKDKKNKEEPNRNSGAEEYNEWNEKYITKH